MDYCYIKALSFYHNHFKIKLYYFLSKSEYYIFILIMINDEQRLFDHHFRDPFQRIKRVSDCDE